jgi:hypothetical protein
MGTCEEELDEDQHGAAGDGGVGDVEGPEVEMSLVHIDEVDHVAKPYAVDQVTDGTTEDE